MASLFISDVDKGSSIVVMPTSFSLPGNRYILQKQLGAGAMGAVYRAQDRLTGRIVALKRVILTDKKHPTASYPSADKSSNGRLALTQEFRTLAILRHPHIISMLDYGFDDQRHLFFTVVLAEAVAGKGSAWLVGGESGIGKSRLLDELRTQALVGGASVLCGQAVENGGQPYQLWRAILLSNLEAGVIKPLVPDLHTLLEREIPDVPELEGQANQQRLHLTIAEICRKAAERTAPPGGYRRSRSGFECIANGLRNRGQMGGGYGS
ncbi:MAG: AAA family ATPase [Chloroflexi bacterium]|nr:AAA family ATPase [Chloroflexota bacterium]